MLYNVKAGIIGLDELGKQFANLLKTHIKNLNLLAACGRTQNELLFAKNDLSLEYVYADEKALFENHDIDVVFIFSEIHLRAHQAIQAIEAGKHVYMMSPIALNVEDAQAVAKVASSHPSQRVMAGSKVRFSPVFKLLKKVIANNQIGIIRHITINADFINSLNKQFGKASGSLFLDKTMDEIELCQYLLNDAFEVVNVRKHGETVLCQADISNTLTMNLTIQPDIPDTVSYLNIYGDKGQIFVSNKDSRSFKVVDKNGNVSVETIHADEQFVYAEYLQLHHFVNAIMGKERIVPTLTEAVNAMQLALAFEKSKVLGGEVKVLD